MKGPSKQILWVFILLAAASSALASEHVVRFQKKFQATNSCPYVAKSHGGDVIQCTLELPKEVEGTIASVSFACEPAASPACKHTQGCPAGTACGNDHLYLTAPNDLSAAKARKVNAFVWIDDGNEALLTFTLTTAAPAPHAGSGSTMQASFKPCGPGETAFNLAPDSKDKWRVQRSISVKNYDQVIRLAADAAGETDKPHYRASFIVTVRDEVVCGNSLDRTDTHFNVGCASAANQVVIIPKNQPVSIGLQVETTNVRLMTTSLSACLEKK